MSTAYAATRATPAPGEKLIHNPMDVLYRAEAIMKFDKARVEALRGAGASPEVLEEAKADLSRSEGFAERFGNSSPSSLAMGMYG